MEYITGIKKTIPTTSYDLFEDISVTGNNDIF